MNTSYTQWSKELQQSNHRLTYNNQPYVSQENVQKLIKSGATEFNQSQFGYRSTWLETKFHSAGTFFCIFLKKSRLQLRVQKNREKVYFLFLKEKLKSKNSHFLLLPFQVLVQLSFFKQKCSHKHFYSRSFCIQKNSYSYNCCHTCKLSTSYLRRVTPSWTISIYEMELINSQ